VFLPFLEKQFPHLVANYKHRYEGRAFLPEAYSKPLSQLVTRFAEKYGLGSDPRPTRTITSHASSEEQMALF
jgi:hypothetical protein